MHPVIENFYEISKIPRGSYKEDKIAAYLINFAKKRGLEAYRDETNNVLIRKPASSGYEKAPTIALQGHTDMVCEKNAGVEHDFEADGIHICRDGDILYADGTTLGADNGYAVALMLTLLDDKTAAHPALECLFTTCEEVGLDGMRAFDAALLKAKMMINLDSCEEDTATAACAGGVRTYFRRSASTVMTEGRAVRLFVGGLMGGHSGEDIHRGRGNALKILSRFYEAAASVTSVQLIDMHGGNKDNAIPRECEVRFLADDPAAVKNAVDVLAEKIRNELCPDDAAFFVTAEESVYTGPVIGSDDSAALLSLLRILPCGPLAMSVKLAGIVETSCNTAIISADASGIEVIVSSRSSIESKLDDLCSVLENCGALTGFTFSHNHRYPGWDFVSNSAIQQIYLAAARRILGFESHIIGIHAGLECGLLSQKRPDMDMISIGPNIWDLHTPQERMSVSSAEKIYSLVLGMLADIH